MTSLRLSDVADDVQVEVVRDAAFENLGFLRHRLPGLLTLLYDERFLDELAVNSDASAVLVTPELVDQIPDHLGVAVARDPMQRFFELHLRLMERSFYWEPFETEIAPDARVHPTAFVDNENVRIGPRCVIEPQAVILQRSVLGADVVVRAGTVIGSQGFEVRDLGGKRKVIPHSGGVRLRDRVEIMANCGVVPSLFGGFTTVGEDTKIDNLVHVGHNAQIGRRVRIAALAMIAGSFIGDDVWIGPSAVISNSLRIGERARITLGSVVTRDVAPGEHVTGNWAIGHDRFLESLRARR